MLSRRPLVVRLLAAATVGAGPLAAVRSHARPKPGPPAPEFAGIGSWLNAEAPLTVASLRGKVVLVDFWTYTCINLRRTAAYLNRWQAEYGASGLQVVGIHTPEFGFERARQNVEAAVREFGIRYPVGQDNGYRTWRAWDNRAWPSFYLLDRDGRIVLVREGEGYARELEGAIRDLLGLARSGAVGRPGDDADLSRIGTPEIYFGSMHPTPQDRAQSPQRGEAAYAFPSARPRLNQYQLDGVWDREEEALILRSPRGGLRVRYSAAKLHLVAGAPKTAALRVGVDGSAPRMIEVGRPTLYTLLDSETYGEILLEFEADTPGLSLFSATFG